MCAVSQLRRVRTPSRRRCLGFQVDRPVTAAAQESHAGRCSVLPGRTPCTRGRSRGTPPSTCRRQKAVSLRVVIGATLSGRAQGTLWLHEERRSHGERHVSHAPSRTIHFSAASLIVLAVLYKAGARLRRGKTSAQCLSLLPFVSFFWRCFL